MKRILFPMALVLSLTGGCSSFLPDPMAQAREAMSEQDYFSARDHVLAALQGNAADVDALTLLAQIQLAMGQGGEALITLDRINEAGGEGPAITLIHAEALLQSGDFEGAFATLEGLESAEAWRIRALSAAMAGNDEEAAQHFLSGREAEGDKRKFFSAAASFHLARGDADAARFAVGQAQQLAPEAIETLFVSARLAELDERPDLSSRAYLAILERAPTDRPALLGAISELDKMGRVDVFAPLIARGREAYPMDLEFIYLEASLMAYEGNWAGARDLLQQRESDISEYDDARGLYGQALMELGQFEQARAQLAPLNRRDPQNQAYARIYAQILLELEEYDRARRVIAPILRGPDAADFDRELAQRAANG